MCVDDDEDCRSSAAVAGLCLWGWTWGWGGGWGCPGWSCFDYGPSCAAGAEALHQMAAVCGTDAYLDGGAYDAAAYDGGCVGDVAVGFEVYDTGVVDAGVADSIFDFGFLF